RQPVLLLADTLPDSPPPGPERWIPTSVSGRSPTIPVGVALILSGLALTIYSSAVLASSCDAGDSDTCFFTRPIGIAVLVTGLASVAGGSTCLGVAPTEHPERASSEGLRGRIVLGPNPLPPPTAAPGKTPLGMAPAAAGIGWSFAF